MIKNTLLYFAASFCLLVTGCNNDKDDNTPKPAQNFELQLLHFADIDGGRDILNNAVRFSALLDRFRQDYNNTLVLSSGDNWIPGPEYNVANDDSLTELLRISGKGRAHIAYLNALGVQASVFGNHEFDAGTEAVANMLKPETHKGHQWVGAQFPYLSSNMVFDNDLYLKGMVSEDAIPSTRQKGKIAGSTVISLGEERIGVVGATTPTLDTLSSIGGITMQPAQSNDIESLAAIIQTQVDQLTNKGINKIIVLAHMQQIEIEQALAPLLTDVDVIVAGGSNTLLADDNDPLRAGDEALDTYPLVYQSPTNTPVLVVNTDGDYTYLGRLVLHFDDNGVIQTDQLDTHINGAYATDNDGLKRYGLTEDDAIAGVAAITNALNQALEIRAGNVVGKTAVYLNGNRVSVRTEETNLGNLTALANLAYAQGIDDSVVASLKNGGGIRAAIGHCSFPPGAVDAEDLICSAPSGIEGINQPGDISQLDIEIALRFNNGLSLVTLTGEQLQNIFEYAFANVEAGVTPGQFPQVAGFHVLFDPAELPGNRVQTLIIGAGDNASVIIKEGILMPDMADKSFRIVTLAFLAEGGDGYPFPPASAATDPVNLVDTDNTQRSGQFSFAADGSEQDVLAEYMYTHYPPDTDPETPVYDVIDTAVEQDRVIRNQSAIN